MLGVTIPLMIKCDMLYELCSKLPSYFSESQENKNFLFPKCANIKNYLEYIKKLYPKNSLLFNIY